MNTAIVTGATSFIGISLIKTLFQNEYTIYAVIRPHSSRRILLNNVNNNRCRFIECNLSDIGQLVRLVDKNYQFDEFYHFGWSSDFDNPRYNLEGQMKNVTYTMDAMRAAKELGCKKFIAVGSQAECGLVEMPINSTTTDNPITAYAKAKCETFRQCCKVSDELGISFYWPRLLSAYGPYDRSHTLVMSCIDACINHKKISLSKAEQIWDFVYVDDVAKSLKLIVEKGEPQKKYSIASGVGRPLGEYIQDIADIYGYPDLMNGIGKRPYSENEVMYLVGDVSEIHEDTGMCFDTDFKKHIADMKEDIC
ncbi:MAG: NAD-dependent epimerase/dehydratase family protein [Spirochaetaceae bacterium]|nr:NAD-dependent epimerase/dehydratase family protein [Spirochaetaceae bacterium]